MSGLRYIFVPGLRYHGESEEQAVRREKLMQEHNDREDELDRRNRLPMAGYREWAAAHGLIERTE